MRNTLIALTLTLVAHTASAQSFAPWDTRGVSREASTTSVAVTPVGFAPWRDRVVVKDSNSATDARMSDAKASVFRPWS